MSDCNITDGDNHCDVDVDDEPVRIDIIVKEYVPPVPTICRMWNKVKHTRSDEFNQKFLEDHPECR